MRMPEPTGDFEDPPEGSNLGRCYRVIDLGTQQQARDGEVEFKRKIMVSFELYPEAPMPPGIDANDPNAPILPFLRMKDGRLFSTSKRYNLSSHVKSTFRKDLENWRGTKFLDSDFGDSGFDISKLLGAPAMLAMAKDTKGEKTYVNIVGIMKPTRGMMVPPLENPKVFLSLEPGEFDSAVFTKLSDNLKDTIRKSPEYAQLSRPTPSAASPPPRADQGMDQPNHGHDDGPPPHDHEPGEQMDADIPF